LHLAIVAERFAAAELLLRKRAQIEAQCRSMLRPLHFACVDANPEITRLLLGYNASIEAEDGSGRRPLHTAFSMDHFLLLNSCFKGVPTLKHATPMAIGRCAWQVAWVM